MMLPCGHQRRARHADRRVAVVLVEGHQKKSPFNGTSVTVFRLTDCP